METWLYIEGTDGCYSVSNEGRVRSNPRVQYHGGRRVRYKGKVLAPGMSSNGYLAVVVVIEGKPVSKLVHILVAEAFKGPRTADTVNHKDLDRMNNRSRNLEWATLPINIQHAREAGKYDPRTNPNIAPKLTIEQVEAMFEMARGGAKQRQIGQVLGVSQQHVSKVLRGERWKTA